jgi:hypothetical protein
MSALAAASRALGLAGRVRRDKALDAAFQQHPLGIQNAEELDQLGDPSCPAGFVHDLEHGSFVPRFDRLFSAHAAVAVQSRRIVFMTPPA